MQTYALCGYTRHLRTCHLRTCHLRTCRYAAIHVNRPSGISQATAIAVNRTKGVKGQTCVDILTGESIVLCC